MARDSYEAQVRLLVRLLPIITEEASFALKGGTAINLFYRDLPRLSVDIDLTYLAIADRASSLAGINDAMDRIAAGARRLRGAEAERIAGGGGEETRVLARLRSATVKIETSPVLRGVVFEPGLRAVSPVVEDRFGFAEANLVAFEDLFAGKIVAALDRQHPRDLFDVKLLYDNEGLTDDLFRVFLVYAASSPRPMHELLQPRAKDIAPEFEREFLGMTETPIELDELHAVRDRLVGDIASRLTGPAAEFLRSLEAGEPDFALIGLADAVDLPAVKWKVQNLKKRAEINPAKHAEQAAAVESLLS